MTAVESHSTTHVSRTRIAQLGDELMSTLTFVTPDTRFPPTGAKYKPALVDINYRATSTSWQARLAFRMSTGTTR